MRKKIASTLSALALVGAGTVLAAQPAQAATSMLVCNSSISWTYIRIVASGTVVNEGRCVGPYADGASVRIDTDPTGASHSYWITYNDGPHGACHTNSDNHSSDPQNYAKVTYRNFDHGNCTN